MLRRSFLKGAAALAAAPALPAAASSASVPSAAVSAPAIAGYRNCFVQFQHGAKVFDANGFVRLAMGLWPDNVTAADADFGRVIFVQHQADGVAMVTEPAKWDWSSDDTDDRDNDWDDWSDD